MGTDLTGTALGDVDLRLAQGLTVEQVVAARPDHTTRLPAAIEADPAVIARIAEVEVEYEARRQQRAGRPARPE